MSRPRAAVAAWQLERYLLRELPAEEMERVRAAVAADDRLWAELRQLEQSNAEILHVHPPSAVARRLAGALGEKPTRRWGSTGHFALAVALLVAFGAPLVWFRPWSVDPLSDGDTRVKGRENQLFLYRKTSAGAEVLASGSVVQPHDVLQVAYQVSKPRYGVIVSIDGRGAVTRHLPFSAGEAVPLQPGAAVSLQQAYELDDAPAFETFFLVTSDRPFAAATVEKAARRAGQRRPDASTRLDVPPAMDQFSVILRRDRR